MARLTVAAIVLTAIATVAILAFAPARSGAVASRARTGLFERVLERARTRAIVAKPEAPMVAPAEIPFAGASASSEKKKTRPPMPAVKPVPAVKAAKPNEKPRTPAGLALPAEPD
jgi:hypothetical protein